MCSTACFRRALCLSLTALVIGLGYSSAAATDDFNPPWWVDSDNNGVRDNRDEHMLKPGEKPVFGANVDWIAPDWSTSYHWHWFPTQNYVSAPDAYFEEYDSFDAGRWYPPDHQENLWNQLGGNGWQQAKPTPMPRNWGDFDPSDLLDNPRWGISGILDAAATRTFRSQQAGTIYFEDWEFDGTPNWMRLTIDFTGTSMVDQVLIDAIAIPEPATMALLAVGGLVLIRRRGRKALAGAGRQKTILLVLALGGCSSLCLAELPESYDLRDVNGSQLLSTRIDDQVGPGPCWAFAAFTAVESNIRLNGLWSRPANELNLSEQFLRANETTGNTWLTTSPGFSRSVNSGGNATIAISHMARLHGPLYESQVPFEYLGDFYDSKPYYDPDHYTTSGGKTHPDKAYPLWPHARPYPAEYTSEAQAAFFLRKSWNVSGIEAIKQAVMDAGAAYVSMNHKFEAYDVATNTYYDDGTAGDPGLGGHGVNIIGWDDSKIVPGAPTPGAWLIKQSHEVDQYDPLYPQFAGQAPTYFWVSYQTSTSRFTDRGEVTFFQMGSMDNIQSVYFHDYTGDLNSSIYLPEDPDGLGVADPSVCAQLFQAGSEADRIGLVSFFTRNDEQPFTVSIYDSMDDLQADEAPLSSLTGVADVAGYHTFELAQAVDVSAGDDFVVFLDFLDGAEQVMAYTRDGVGNSGSVEMIQDDWCYYYDTTDDRWEDLADAWQGMTFTVKAYGVVIPEPGSLAILSLGAGWLLRRRRG